jgi:hypothetical protein
MRTGFTFLFFLWGAVMFVLAVVQLAKGKVSEAVPLGVMALIGFLLAFGTWSLIGRQQKAWEEEKRQMAAVKPPVKVIPPPPARPIEMRRTGASISDTVMWAIGFFLVAVGLAVFPDVLWTRWLAYPVAVVSLALAAGVAYVAVGQRNQRCVADANGVDVWGLERVAWKDVASVTLVEERAGSRSRRVGVLDRYLLLESKAGEELLRLEELAPPEEYRRFLDAIPAWTGRPVQEKTVLR